MTDEEKIKRLEFIVSEIDGALCNYCNDAADEYGPPSDWAAGVRKSFDSLCDAYNLWHEKHEEVGDISMKYFLRHDQLRMALREIVQGRYKTVERIVDRAKKVLKDSEEN